MRQSLQKEGLDTGEYIPPRLDRQLKTLAIKAVASEFFCREHWLETQLRAGRREGPLAPTPRDRASDKVRAKIATVEGQVEGLTTGKGLVRGQN